MTFNKNARKLYNRFLLNNEVIKDGRGEYFFHEGFKFEKRISFDKRQSYHVYSTYYDSYQEIIQEAILDVLLRKDSLKGLIYVLAKINSERNSDKFLQLLTDFLNDL